MVGAVGENADHYTTTTAQESIVFIKAITFAIDHKIVNLVLNLTTLIGLLHWSVLGSVQVWALDDGAHGINRR